MKHESFPPTDYKYIKRSKRKVFTEESLETKKGRKKIFTEESPETKKGRKKINSITQVFLSILTLHLSISPLLRQ